MASTTERGKKPGHARMRNQPQVQSQPGLGRDKYLFGSDEEVANREADGDNPGLHPPPRFQQIVAADTGKDMNNPSGPTHSGHMKFSSGPNA